MSGAAQPIDRRAFLNQCRGAVERQLGKELEPLLEKLPGQLDELGRQSRDRDERDQYSQASARLSRDREAFFAAFRKEYGDSFEAYAKALQGAAPPVGTPGRDELAAMKTNVLENEVAVGKLAARFKEHATAELTELSARVASMFKRGGLGDGDNPLGPLPIARGVYAGFSALKIEGRAMKAIRGELEKRLPDVVREMYQNANRAFAGLGIEPATGRGVAPAPAPAPAARRRATSRRPTRSQRPRRRSPTRSPARPCRRCSISSSARPGCGWLHARTPRAVRRGSRPPATTQELVWSLKPKPDPAERAKLVGALPGLLKKVGVAMEAELDPDGRKLVFDALMAHHREILQPAAKPGG